MEIKKNIPNNTITRKSYNIISHKSKQNPF